MARDLRPAKKVGGAKKKAAPQDWGKTRKTPPVDLSDLTATVTRVDPNVSTLGHGYKQIPPDVPVFIRVTRLLRKSAPRTDLPQTDAIGGHTIELQVLNGPQIYIRVGFNPDQTVKVFIKEQNSEEVELLRSVERGARGGPRDPGRRQLDSDGR